MNQRRMYETVFIVNAALEDAAIDTLVNTTADFIKNNGGTIETLDKWGRRRLAYPINKKHNGFYVYVLYDGPATMQPQLERYFQLEENVIRHLVMKMTPQSLEYRKTFLENRTERMLPVGPERVAMLQEQAAAKAAAKAEAEAAAKIERSERAAATAAALANGEA